MAGTNPINLNHGMVGVEKRATKVSKHVRGHFHFGSSIWIVLDYLLAVAALGTAFYLSPHRRVFAQGGTQEFLVINLYAICVVIAAHVFGLHGKFFNQQRASLAGKSIAIGLLCSGALNLVEWLVFYGQIGRYVQLFCFLVTTFGLYAYRVLLLRFQKGMRRRVIVLCGAGDGAALLDLIHKKQGQYELVGLYGRLPANWNNPGNLLLSEIPLWHHCRDLSIHEVLFYRMEGLSADHISELELLLRNGVLVRDYLHFIEQDFGCVPVEIINVGWFFHLNTTGDYCLAQAVKRLIDIMIAGVGLIISAPLLLAAAVFIKLESRGPVFYTQTRVGEFGRPFKIWKLRSMRTDAEAGGACWAAQNDRRTTRVGRVLRKTRLDELPQLWNILKAEMSFVGPRPERPEFVAQLEKSIPYYGQRHRIKPGLTGWAQINYPYGSSVEDAVNKLSYDLYYLNNFSPLLDTHIFLRTVGVIMRGSR